MSPLSISKQRILWSSGIESLYKSKPSKSAEKLLLAGFKSLYELLWISPLKIQVIPKTSSFNSIKCGNPFRGEGIIQGLESKPAFSSRGRRGAKLFHLSATIKDKYSDKLLRLKWFNCYGSMIKKIHQKGPVFFRGDITEFQGRLQMINPKIGLIKNEEKDKQIIEVYYPTLNGISSSQLKIIYQKIPEYLWNEIPEIISEDLRKERNFLPLSICFQIHHGRFKKWTSELQQEAKKRLIYHEFLLDQLKLYMRRKCLKSISSKRINLKNEQKQIIKKIFPYSLTNDQKNVFNEILEDFKSGQPMMRLLQGDVGCGKTTVALMASMAVIQNKNQVALMCPTESLARQHFETTKEILPNSINISLILGPTRLKEKKMIRLSLAKGEIDLIIGTHSLIQKEIKFKNLALAIIDEQHKFGVDQRLKLLQKGIGTHSLIMTATPIPRSLSLTQYGDLNISTIKSMPQGRKGQKTKIINKQTYPKFLSFVKTRIEMGEQAYIVVPAIEETQSMNYISEVLQRFKKHFPLMIIKALHGKLASDEKENTIQQFRKGEIDILIATSIIEVGINILNASIMAIMGPERFGLSSLHQLRGRVGRGSLPGFCFLIQEKNEEAQVSKRLQIIEKTTDGFLIAEEDLKIRGEGQLFGTGQSGESDNWRIGNLIEHEDLLFQAKEDLEKRLLEESPTFTSSLFDHFKSDEKIFLTT